MSLCSAVDLLRGCVASQESSSGDASATDCRVEAVKFFGEFVSSAHCDALALPFHFPIFARESSPLGPSHRLLGLEEEFRGLSPEGGSQWETVAALGH